jgi:hypothetical protein
VKEDYPFLRQVSSPILDEQLRPLDPRCRVVQFNSPLTESDHRKLAAFICRYPKVPLRVYGHYGEPLQNLSFLKHYPFLAGFQVDVFHLESTAGIENLPNSLQYFGFGQTKSRKHTLDFLRRFNDLRELFLEGQSKDIEAVSTLAHLQKLTLRSITLPDLKLLLPLANLWSLDIKLGGTNNLELLPRIGRLKYLELWMIKGLRSLDAIGETRTLQNIYLQALKNVTVLPSLRNLEFLRRVTIDTMKGLTDLSPISQAPSLEELLVLSGNQWEPRDFRPFVGHPSLKTVVIGLGSVRKNRETEALLGLSRGDGPISEFEYR